MKTSFERYDSLRKENGLTHKAVSEATGISHATLSEWKRGLYTPKTDKLQKIAEYFGVPLDYLLTGHFPTPEESSHFYTDEDAREFAQFMFENPKYKVLFKASSKVKEEDIAIVKTLLDKFAEDEEVTTE